MNRQNLQKEKLDEIGRRLLEAAAMQSDELEQIAAAPHLFDSVRDRIKTEQSRRKPKRFVVNFLNWQTASAAFAILIVLAVGAAFVFKSKDTDFAENNPVPPAQDKPEQAVNPTPQDAADFPDFNKSKNPSVKNRIIARNADSKIETPKLKNQERKPNPTKHLQNQKKESEGTFYSLAIAGSWEADGEALQIVRAELSRAELFALGVNLPVADETPKIKTDLLVGANGVPRAIRFVE